MKSDFLIAITQLAAEKNLPQQLVIDVIETALVSAYKKADFAASQNISVKVDPTVGSVKVWAEKTIVELPSDAQLEISLDEARRIKQDAQIGDIVMVEATPRSAGRIAAQTAKQVILQRLHEAEHNAIFEEYSGKEGDIFTGLIQRIEPRQIFVDLGRAKALLPSTEQVHSERYRVGQRLKVYILEVTRTAKGPRVVVSRSHPNLVRRLFELEIPEVLNGIVEIKSIAREAGYRSKVAVAAVQEGIDPVGCCVGLRGIRIQNVVSELNGEKLDIVTWNPDTSAFISNALGSAQVLSVALSEEEGVATVVVPDKQLSLAIGREGQNARLAAKLTGWRIDIKSASEAETEKAEAAKLAAETGLEAAVSEEVPTGVDTEALVEEGSPAEGPPVPDSALVSAQKVKEEVESPLDTTLAPQEVAPLPPAEAKPQVRFAEDLVMPEPAKPEAKPKKKKKKGAYAKRRAEDGIKIKKVRRGAEISLDEDYEGLEKDAKGMG